MNNACVCMRLQAEMLSDIPQKYSVTPHLQEASTQIERDRAAVAVVLATWGQ